MKRATELKKFSEDHHHGLVHARRLKMAATSAEASTAQDAARDFLAYWQVETSAHFRQEEEVLLPVLVRHGGDLHQDSIVQMLSEHAEIRALVMDLSDGVASENIRPETLQSIGDRLEEHIRLEERVIYPMIEETLPKTGLEEVSSRLEVKESGPQAEPWVPTEGLSYGPWPGPGDSEGGGWDLPSA